MRTKWNIRSKDSFISEKISKSLNISPLLAQILVNRNITESIQAEKFLKCRLENLHNPLLLKDIDKAQVRIKKAISEKEKILIYGDYDVDGITSVVLLVRVLKRLGAIVSYYIPDRIQEGYGLNDKGIKFALENNINLIITVDCGISNIKEIEELKAHRIDVIITDHHRPHLNSFPVAAIAVINPFQDGCKYPFKELSGVGVCFKLACMFLEERLLTEYFDLIALGTIADVSCLIDENRIFVKYGLERIQETENLGIKALLEVSGLFGKKIQSGHIGYILGPRLNASGRVGQAKASVELLLSDSYSKAKTLAKELNQTNRERQSIENKILKEAMQKVENFIDFTQDRIILLHQDDWHLGVVGIVASKLVDRFYRPVILTSFCGNLCRGSGRSIANFHLFNAISKCADLLEEFGGHKWACGLSVHKKNLSKLYAKLNEIAHQVILPEDLIPKIDIDFELSLEQLDEDFLYELEYLYPFGPGNPKPTFATENLTLKVAPSFMKKNGIKMWLTDGRATYEAVGFGIAEKIAYLKEGEKINLAYYPYIDNWEGVDRVKLEIKDIKIHK